jgi:hypothetical protein
MKKGRQIQQLQCLRLRLLHVQSDGFRAIWTRPGQQHEYEQAGRDDDEQNSTTLGGYP